MLKVHPSHGHDQTIVNGISRIGYMTGGKAALWKDEEMSDVFMRKGIAFIERQRTKPFFLFFASHEPHVPRVTLNPRIIAVAREVLAVATGEHKASILKEVLQGERDYQVTLTDLERWRQALADRPNVKFIAYPKLNHLFVAGEGKSTPAEYSVPGNVAAGVIQDIAAWIEQSPATAPPKKHHPPGP